MSAYQRRKGHDFERFVVRILEFLWPVRRGQQGDGPSHCDVEGSPFWIECECSNRPGILAKVKQALEDTDGRPIAVFTKQTRGEVLVTMQLKSWLSLVQGIDWRNRKPMTQELPATLEECFP